MNPIEAAEVEALRITRHLMGRIAEAMQDEELRFSEITLALMGLDTMWKHTFLLLRIGRNPEMAASLARSGFQVSDILSFASTTRAILSETVRTQDLDPGELEAARQRIQDSIEGTLDDLAIHDAAKRLREEVKDIRNVPLPS